MSPAGVVNETDAVYVVVVVGDTVVLELNGKLPPILLIDIVVASPVIYHVSVADPPLTTELELNVRNTVGGVYATIVCVACAV